MDWRESNPEHRESLSLSLFNQDLLERLGGSWTLPRSCRLTGYVARL